MCSIFGQISVVSGVVPPPESLHLCQMHRCSLLISLVFIAPELLPACLEMFKVLPMNSIILFSSTHYFHAILINFSTRRCQPFGLFLNFKLKKTLHCQKKSCHSFIITSTTHFALVFKLPWMCTVYLVSLKLAIGVRQSD